MTQQEKELIDFIHSQHILEIGSAKQLAKSSIAKYPQILADKVWEGDFTTGAFLGIPPISVPRGKYQVFIRQVKS